MFKISGEYSVQERELNVKKKQGLASTLDYTSTHRYEVTKKGYKSSLTSFRVKDLKDPLEFFNEAAIESLSDTTIVTETEILVIDKSNFKAIFEDGASINCQLHN